jgi:hypothetical protein
MTFSGRSVPRRRRGSTVLRTPVRPLAPDMGAVAS